MPYFLTSLAALMAGAAVGIRCAFLMAETGSLGTQVEFINTLLNSGSVGLLAATMFYIWYKQGKDNERREDKIEKRHDKIIATMREDNRQEREAAVAINRDRYDTVLDKVENVIRVQSIILALLEKRIAPTSRHDTVSHAKHDTVPNEGLGE